jgi:mannose-6-phosphate isomerase class I
MCVQGSGAVIIDDFIAPISFGETVLIPAKCKEVMLKGEELELLEIYLDCNKL